MGYPVRADQTDVTVYGQFLAETTGANATGVTYNSSGMSVQYIRQGAAPVTITLSALSSAGAAHSDGGFLHLTMGACRIDLPDAVCASGVAHAHVVGSATSMVMPMIDIDLNLDNAADVADAVWDEDMTAHTTADTSGYKIGSLTFTTANLLNVRVNNVAGVTLQQNGTGNKLIGST